MNNHSPTAKSPQSASAEGNRPRVRDKRSAILRAALELFAEGGVNGIPMPLVAEQAGVGTGTIYRYFASKELLVNELFRELKVLVNRRLYADLDLHRQPRVVFDWLWLRTVRDTPDAPDLYRFLGRRDHRPYLGEQSRPVEREALSPIVGQYRALQKRGVFRKDIRAEVLMTLV